MNSQIVQKRVQKQVRQSAGMYIMNFAALNSSINTTNEGIKHGSYQRRLNRLKGKVLKGNGKKSTTAVKGNKTKSQPTNSIVGNCDCE